MNWDNKFASDVKAVPFSGIRKFFDLASSMKDVISLGVGEPDYAAPDKVIHACIDSLERKETSYTSNWGLLELREEIAKLFAKRYGLTYDPKDEIMVTVGVSEAIGLVMTTFLNPGDEVLIPDPAYLAYPACVSIAHGVPVLVPTYAKDEFRLTVEELEKKVTPKTKAILIGYPNNPTGTIMDRASLEKVAAFAKAHDLIVIADEIYCDLTYEGQHTCFASLPDMQETERSGSIPRPENGAERLIMANSPGGQANITTVRPSTPASPASHGNRFSHVVCTLSCQIGGT